ncbi:MAG: helix-turn-helix transcriptional regulator, partial [Lachnospiraceae bacterium]|nr:helix-turn-helix transcriptional regulator [Lachnospiraceae bacterium]
QEELAEALYVSRTAVSKWESGRGYPGIDSLKEISRFFGVTIDGLLGADEILSAAEQEKERLIGRYTSFICSALDILTVILLFIPVFGNGDAAHSAVSLTGLTAVSPWVRIFFTVVIIVTVLNGVCGAVISHLDRPAWNRHRLLTGIGLSVIGTAVFLMTRQPYAGILCLAVLVIKITLLLRGKDR